MVTFETEIRNLQPVVLCTLAQYLDESSYWKKLMAIVPKDDNENVYLFNHNHFRMIEQAIRQQQRSGAEIFLSEWSTLNKKRPTCKLLLDLLVKIEFFKAADYLAVDVLKIDAPERPKQGPGAVVDVSDQMLEKLLREQVGIETDSAADLSWSVHYVEKPTEMIPLNAEKVQPEIERSDLIEFSVDRSDMIKFSETVVDDLKKLPEKVSSMMKFDSDNVDENSEYPLKNYGLHVVDSANIPLCVNNDDEVNSDQNISNLSTTTQTTISSSTSNNDYDSALPTVSETDIPIAVLKYSDKSYKNT